MEAVPDQNLAQMAGSYWEPSITVKPEWLNTRPTGRAVVLVV